MKHASLRPFALVLPFALCLLPFALHGAQASGAISGVVVVDDAAAQPLRRVTVTLASGDLVVPQTTTTDEAGRFAFAEIAAGNYTLRASRPGYVSAFYGAKQPGKGPGVPIAVLEGKRVADIRVKMLRGGAITGIIRQEGGQPSVGIDVMVSLVRLVNGQRRASQNVEELANIRGITTDDRGRYRAFGLSPGDYVIQAAVGMMRPMLGGAAPGRLVTPAEIQWALQASPSSSQTPGQAAAPLPPAPSRGQAIDYSPVYYPGTVSIADAAVVTIGPGDERDGIDFSTKLVPTAAVAGTVIDPEGRPGANAQLSLRPLQGELASITDLVFSGAGARAKPDGTFALNGVRPGKYVLMVRGAPVRADGTAPAPSSTPGLEALAMMGGFLGGAGGANALTLWATQDVTVDGRDQTGLVLQLRPGMSVSGKLVFEASTMQPPADLSRARVMLLPNPTGASPTEMAGAMFGAAMSMATADGTFTLKDITPNAYRLNVLVPGMRVNPSARTAGWALKSIMLNGRDVADLPLEVRPNESVAGLVVTMTDHPTELSGQVLDQAGRAAPGFPIVVFSTNRAYWTVASTRVQQVRPSNDGKFFLAGLPAGEYYVCAVTDLDPSELYDPPFLEQLAASAFKITLGDGEKKTQNLRLAGGGSSLK